LVLKVPAGSAKGLIAAGLFFILWGSLAWLALVRGDGTNGFTIGLVLPFAGALAVIGGVTQIGTVYLIDGTTQSLTIRKRFGPPVSMGRECFQAIVLEVLPTNLHQRETCRVTLVSSPQVLPSRQPQTRLRVIGMRRTDQPDAIHLVNAAVQIGRLLALPVEGKGEVAVGGEALRAAVIEARRPPSQTAPQIGAEFPPVNRTDVDPSPSRKNRPNWASAVALGAIVGAGISFWVSSTIPDPQITRAGIALTGAGIGALAGVILAALDRVGMKR
jgi:hypothetical protein